MQVGKGRDVGLNQISKFEAKVANGNSEQTISRDIYRLGHRFDFFRMLSCYFTTIGFYFNSLVIVKSQMSPFYCVSSMEIPFNLMLYLQILTSSKYVASFEVNIFHKISKPIQEPYSRL